MQHLAIMKKSWGLTEKILSGKKKIESRWYSVRYRPWNSIKAGETIYFKNSGEPVNLKAQVSRVMQFSSLNPGKVREILDKYGEGDGIEKEKIPEFFQRFKDKKYCLLIFLKNPKRIEPFQVNKAGYGMMSSWISLDDISKIKRYS